jgi:acetoin utilization protein AcuB
MTPTPVSITPETPLREVLGLMKDHQCRQLPVVEGERVVGIVTDRDVRLVMNSPLTMRERFEDEMLLRTVTAADCMTPDPMTIDVNDPAANAADLLRTFKFGSLPVVDSGYLVGIVTVSDILTSFIKLLRENAASTG